MSIENTDINEARLYKPWLRFEIGTTVHLKSDLKKKTPMTIALIIYDDEDIDYRCTWMNSQKMKEVSCFHDHVLTL